MERLEFVLASSRILLGMLCLIYGGAAVLFLYMNIAPIMKAIGFILSLYYLKKNVYLHYLKNQAEEVISGIWQDPNGQWGIQAQSGFSYKVSLLPDSYRSRYLLILRFQTVHRLFTVIIPRDALSGREYKVLTLRLLFCGNEEEKDHLT